MLCNPDILQPALDILFQGDPDFDSGQMTDYAYSPFGQIFAWHTEHWTLNIDMGRGLVSCFRLVDPSRKFDPDMALLGAVGSNDNEVLDEEDETGKFLFTRAKRSLGDLEYGECYGFVPALALGGPKRLENLRRLPAREHFAILAQAQEFVLRDNLSRPIRDLRPIGAQ